MPGGQFLPSLDLFAEGSPSYGDQLLRLIAIQPWTLDFVTGYSMITGWGHFYDGYAGTTGFPASCASSTKHSTVPDDDRGIWSVYREFDEDDVEVRFHPELVMLLGVSGPDTVRQCGICARVSNGTFVTPSGGNHSDQYYRDVDGYFFVHAKQAGLRNKLFLLRVDAGFITVLGQQFVDELLGGSAFGFDAELPMPMRMTIEQPAGDATIKCYRRRFIQSVGNTLIGGNPGVGGVTEDLVFDVTDSSPVAAGGRCGFGLQLSKSEAAGDSVLVARSFEVSTFSGTLRMRDRFRRLNPAAPPNVGAARALLDPLSQPGNSLGTSWTGDSQGEPLSSFKHFGHLKRVVGLGQIVVGSTPPAGTGQVHGWYMNSRLGGSFQQHRVATFTVINATTETVRCGIHLRGAWFPTTFYDFRARETVGGAFRDYRKQGYLALVKYEPGASPVWELEIRAHRQGGDTNTAYRSTLLATLDLTSIGLAVGTGFIFDFEVRNFDGQQFGFGQWPACRVKINFSIKTPVVEPGLQGSVVENDDWIIDMRSEAPDDGRMEGFYVDVDAVHPDGLVRVDTWQEQALTDPPPPDEQNQDSVVLLSETAALTGTLVTPLSWPVTELWDGIHPLRHRFETDQLQTFPRDKTIRRTWAVQVQGGTRAERVAVRDFFDSHESITIPFTWVHPATSVIHNVKFISDEFAHAMMSAQGDGFEGWEFELQEVFDHSTYNVELP